MSMPICRPRLLTPEQAAQAVRRSREINPVAETGWKFVDTPAQARRRGGRRLAVVIGHRWPATGVVLSVQFLDGPSIALRKRILLHLNAWSQSANVRFEQTGGLGMVRIARLDSPAEMAGYWSYVGTEILGIEPDEPTMNLDSFTMKTHESEFLRVVRHEAGHTLGFDHEHMRTDLVDKIDRKKAIVYYRKTQNWSAEETIQQVLTPLAESSLMGTTETDPLSIMCYDIPAEITKDGKAIPGGIDINPTDYAFAAKVYPKIGMHALSSVPASKPAVPLAEPQPALTSESVPTLAPARKPACDDALHIVVMDAIEPDSTSAPTTSHRFARIFASYGGARVTAQMRLRAAEGEPPTRWNKIIGTHERIKRYTNLQGGTLPDEKEMLSFGEDLFQMLFQADVRRLYDEARSRQRTGRLDLILTSMIPWIAEKPWEFAYDSTRRSFLATEDVHFVRNVLTAIPADRIEPRQGPLAILVAAAQPVGTAALAVEEETALIRRGFETLADAGLATIDVLPRATPGSVHHALSSGRFDVVHLIGHGEFDESTKEGSLIFEDEFGRSFPLGQRSVRELFCGRGLSLVFLNACQTGSGGRADFNKGLAQALVAHGLPALVANQYSVLDSSATVFAQHLYAFLAGGMSLAESVREARIAVNCSLQGEAIDWAVPVVYARDPDMTVSSRREAASTALFAAANAPPRARRVQSVDKDKPRIAVWDIDNALPALDDALRTLNEAEQRFSFDRADLSVPLDAWDFDERKCARLKVERLQVRLAPAAAELHAKLLVGVTIHSLSRTKGPGEGNSPVLVVSLADEEVREPEGGHTPQVLAKALAAAIRQRIGDGATASPASLP